MGRSQTIDLLEFIEIIGTIAIVGVLLFEVVLPLIEKTKLFPTFRKGKD